MLMLLLLTLMFMLLLLLLPSMLLCCHCCRRCTAPRSLQIATEDPPPHFDPHASILPVSPVSFIWDAWKWVFSGDGDCGTVTGGFGSFPTFSIQAYDWYGGTVQCLVVRLAPSAPSAPITTRCYALASAGRGTSISKLTTSAWACCAPWYACRCLGRRCLASWVPAAVC